MPVRLELVSRAASLSAAGTPFVWATVVRAVTSPEKPLPAGTTALVVDSHGSDEEPILSAALRAGIPYVGLVASRTRGPAVLASLAVDDALRTAVDTPAGRVYFCGTGCRTAYLDNPAAHPS
jgi:xanthine dehydrogenase accessory factor